MTDRTERKEPAGPCPNCGGPASPFCSSKLPCVDDPAEVGELVERLRALMAAATPGPYRAHDHNDMARVGADPADWVGYGWVGRIKKDSGPNGEFDAGWLDVDRRKDGLKEYRERASADVHFVAEALNALPQLLEAADALASRDATIAALTHEADTIEKNLQSVRSLCLDHEHALAALERKMAEAVELLRMICEMQKRNFGSRVATHLALVDLTNTIRDWLTSHERSAEGEQ